MGGSLSRGHTAENEEDAAAPPTASVASENAIVLPVELLSDEVGIPRRATASAAGFDLKANQDVVLRPDGQYVPVSTGVKLAMDSAPVTSRLMTGSLLSATIRSRSGMAKKQIEAFAGLIDADYRGEVIVMLRNFSDVEVQIEKGDRIAQLVFSVVVAPNLAVFESLSTEFPIGEGARGEGGFGSTDAAVPASDLV